MAAIDQIIEWAQGLPDWQSDAIRRILTQDELTTQDETEILAMLKDRHGLGDPENPAPKPIPITKGVSGTPQTKVRLVLKAVQGLKNVNAIPDGSYIPLGHEGITVIYGENGAGKSGYARVLKRACSAKDKRELIHPNIYGAPPAGPAAAVFKVGVEGGSDQEIPWVDGSTRNDLLANVAIFDAKSAHAIVDDENDVSFRPHGTHVFDDLVALFKKIHETLKSEKPVPIVATYQDVPPETPSGKFLTTISATTPQAAVDIAGSWVDKDVEGLAQISTRISEAESPDRNAKIRRLKSLSAAIKGLADEIERIDGALSSANEASIIEKTKELTAADQALAVAAKQSVGNEPLPGVGEKVWQTLYLAAKEYSLKQAYPSQPFPVINTDALCVLCMQPIAEDTRSRFERFKEFVEQSAMKRVESATSDVHALLEPIRKLNFLILNQDTDAVQEINGRDHKTAESINIYQKAMKERAARLLEVGERKTSETAHGVVSTSKDSLSKIIELIAGELSEAEKGLTADELRFLKVQKRELEARRALGTHKTEILLLIEKHQKSNKYDKAIAETSLHGVSANGKRIISGAMTPDLQKALRAEFDALGVAHLPLDMKSTRSDGEVVHKLVLTKGVLPKKAALTDILSEGEQRVVAIAGFLAELVASKESCPIVFDDPVSSLSHKYRDKIAARLIEEAIIRQVVVFTHDIAFLTELEKHAAQSGNVKMSRQTIRRRDQTPGHSAQGAPWHAMTVNDRLNLLINKLSVIAPLHVQDQARYNEEAANLYGKLRETWEACVEESLLNGVIRRHGSEVKTLSLQGVEVTNAAYRQLHFAMGKCSEWMTGHDKSRALSEGRPDPAEFKKDIEALQLFHKGIHKRADELQKERKEQLKPAVPAVG